MSRKDRFGATHEQYNKDRSQDREHLVKRLAASKKKCQPQKTPPPKVPFVDDHQLVQDLQLRRIESASLVNPSLPAAKIVNLLRRVWATGQSEVAFLWPYEFSGHSFIHAYAQLTDITQGYEGFADAGMTIFYPASRRTGSNQRSLLIDREYLVSINKDWLNKTSDGLNGIEGSRERCQARYHTLLNRVKDLSPSYAGHSDSLQRKLEAAPERQHPSLYEVTPRKFLDPDPKYSKEPEDGFFRRSMMFSDLSGIVKVSNGQVSEAIEPKLTPWLLVSWHGLVRGQEFISRTPVIKERHPDAILLDLTYRARRRLGLNWKKIVKREISSLPGGLGSIPMLCVTEDPFVANFARFELIGTVAKKGKRRPGKCTFIHNRDRDPTSKRTAEEKPFTCEKIEIATKTFASDLALISAEASTLRKSVAGLADDAIAKSIDLCVGVLRSIVNLPTSVDELFNEAQETKPIASWMAKNFDLGGAVSTLREQAANADRYEADLNTFADKVIELSKSMTQDGSGAATYLNSLFDDISKKGTNSLVVFPDALSSEIIEDWLECSRKGDFLSSALESKIRITHGREAQNLLIHGNSFGRVVFVSPKPRDFFAALTHYNLPKRIIIIADASGAKSIVKYGEKLMEFCNEEPSLQRIETVIKAINESLDANIVDLPDFTYTPSYSVSADYIDLTYDGDSHESGDVTTIEMTNDIVVRAFDTSEMVVRDHDFTSTYRKVLAKDLSVGDEVVVAGPEFLAVIRDRYDLKAQAEPLLAEYHNLIQKARDELDGGSIKEKSEKLYEQMRCLVGDKPLPDVQSVIRWLDIESQEAVCPDLRIPQAPRHRHVFDAFTTALGIDPQLAGFHWQYGIVPTRGARISSGANFRKLYFAALVDPDSVSRHYQGYSELIMILKDIATEFTSVVRNIKKAQERSA
ncbi:MAG: hypothetical protein OQK24_12760 [Magnetovibrio sp.]|nr:hypothetical protein [Magnetovibrio sp.]